MHDKDSGLVPTCFKVECAYLVRPSSLPVCFYVCVCVCHTLQDCPTSGQLLSESIRMAPRPAQKAKSTDALKKNASDPYILATIGDLFWRNRKVENARSWFKRWV